MDKETAISVKNIYPSEDELLIRAERRLSRKGLIRFWKIVGTIAALGAVSTLLWNII